ncbi:hypothetical protein OIU85_021911 [Salix viminalis]|uniref:Uncharacterized protein n=1 Tax=Salix viminalis TaxID=40686 RepID=A0A9Q0ZE53_SALVM|nr:hypothetical protein OIU85_021911 [Salix viminalis]
MLKLLAVLVSLEAQLLVETQIAGLNLVWRQTVEDVNLPSMLLDCCLILAPLHVYLLILSWTRDCKFLAPSAKAQLGRPENNLYVECSLTSSSKVHLASLVKERMERCIKNKSTCVPVLVTDISSVDQRLCNVTLQDARQKGVWSEEDGCVFNSVFCPFCSMSNCLGVKIMATDASNVQLLNKILFYTDRLEFQNLEASKDLEPKDKDLSPVTCLDMDKTALLNSLDRFSYSQQPNAGGWRTTKSKLRLPKRGMLSNTQG